jgi:hypothetical protein
MRKILSWASIRPWTILGYAVLFFIALAIYEVPWHEIGLSACQASAKIEADRAGAKVHWGDFPEECTIGHAWLSALVVLDKYGVGVTAAFTFVLAVSTILLWLSTQATVSHARQTAERELRAYITITKHRALHYRTMLDHIIVPCFTVINHGQTPAYNVTVTIMARYDLAEHAETLPLVPAPGGSFTLNPGEKTVMTADLPPLDDALITALDSGAKVLILLGEVLYVDAFGRNRRTRMRASSNKDSVVKADGSVQLEWHGSDNDAT